METLRRSCAKVHEPSELWFGMVRAVGPGIAVLDEGLHCARGRGSLGDSVPRCLLLPNPMAPQQVHAALSFPRTAACGPAAGRAGVCSEFATGATRDFLGA